MTEEEFEDRRVYCVKAGEPGNVEKAYNLLAMHHSETLGRMMELQNQLMSHHCWYCRWKHRLQAFFNRGRYD